MLNLFLFLRVPFLCVCSRFKQTDTMGFRATIEDGKEV